MPAHERVPQLQQLSLPAGSAWTASTAAVLSAAERLHIPHAMQWLPGLPRRPVSYSVWTSGHRSDTQGLSKPCRATLLGDASLAVAGTTRLTHQSRLGCALSLTSDARAAGLCNNHHALPQPALMRAQPEPQAGRAHTTIRVLGVSLTPGRPYFTVTGWPDLLQVYQRM